MTQPKNIQKMMNDELNHEVVVTTSCVFISKKALPLKVAQGLTTFETDTDPIVLAKDCPLYVKLPRYFFSTKDLSKFGRVVNRENTTNYSFDDSVEMSFQPGIAVRKNQEAAWKALKSANNGILNLACGKGKTFLALAKIAHSRTRTLIIAPQVAHLKNWESELKKFFNFTGTIGWIRGSKCEAGDIVFATVQTIAKDPDKFSAFLEDNQIGMAIYDECHCMSARYFSKAASVIQSGKRIGLSATPNRKDRNEGIFTAHVGKVFYSDITQELVPTVYVKTTPIKLQDARKHIGSESHIARLRNYLIEHDDRNKFICDLISKKLKEGRTVYVLSHSVSHVEWLSEQFDGSTFIHGGVAADKRVDLLNSGNPVIATIAIGREAYNRVDLDTLFLVTPFAADSHSAITLEQSVGRILRASPNKLDPEVFIFRDPDVNGMLTGMLRSVIRESRRRGYKVIDPQTKTVRRTF